MAVTEEVLGEFHGSDEFPIEWQEGEKELFWIYDDLHIPNPVSPMFFDIGGWWLTCDHMFRRFGTPFACDWIAKEINGYVYTAAVPCNAELHSEATEYQARYVPRVPRNPDHAEEIGTYLGWVLPEYAGNFLAWWRERLRPEIERNFEYLDGIDYDAATMREMAVYLEDAIDVHDRHWKIHWMLNFAQFASTTNLNQVIAEVRGGEDPGLMGRLQSSLEDRNWDSIEDLWKMKEEVKGDGDLAAAFKADTAADIMRALEGSERGARFIEERIVPHQQAFGYKAIWSHEFAFRTWREDPAPILEAVRGYLATDYEYPANIAAVRDDLEAAKREVMEGVDGEARERLQTALEFPYNALWGFPEKFYAGEPSTTGEVRGLAASPGVVEGPARFVASLDEFDQVRDGEILVCRMTNPAWVVLFTKITGLVTEAGGAVSHPAVVAREFGIPAVVGTTNAGERIKTGDRIRVNGTTGVVEILA